MGPITDEKSEKQVVEARIFKPFTIQVGAYLKQSHALTYLNRLKQKGVDAAVRQVAGGDKTWYVIRVSEFETKRAAAAFGNKLKSGQVIDDFFVCNR